MGTTPFEPPSLLDGAWLRASTPPGEGLCPPGLDWQPAEAQPRGSDAEDHWFRRETSIPPGAVLEFQGLATWTEIWLDGRLAATHRTMHRPLDVPVPHGACLLEICARALRPEPGHPRPRWRNRLVPGEALRQVRTSLLGRIPGTGAPLVGPWGPVLLHRAPPLRARLRAWMEDGDGVVELRLEGRPTGPAGLALHVLGARAALREGPDGPVATLRIAAPPLWWPHTHGAPACHDAALVGPGGQARPLGRVGFRTVVRAPGPGFGVVLNGVPVFCRGALCTEPSAPLGPARAAGLNMLRVPGFASYQAPNTAAAGLMLWQDFMFARFDYPLTPAFIEEVRAEIRHVLAARGADPSLVVLCGGDEVDQAAAMAGRPAGECRHALFHSIIAEEVAALRPDVLYVPNAPHGAVPPFAASAEVTHYFGVGAYQRPLHEARGVRFAAACLAFSNPPDAEGCRTLSPLPGDAAWAAAVPRDPGASWTFEDVRDHYAATLFGADMAGLRRTEPERWLALGRAAVALAMQSAMATWRTDPGCGGALVLELQDARPGPGWGLMDHAGRPKSALHALSQVCQPIQVLLHDGGQDGVILHVLNDTAAPLAATLRLRGLALSGTAEWLGELPLELPPHGRAAYPATAVMGRFVDLTGAWRFGPAPFTVLGAVLEAEGRRLSTATLFLPPAMPRERLGLVARFRDGVVAMHAERFAQFVTIDAGALEPGHDHIHLWPGETTEVAIRPPGSGDGAGAPEGGSPRRVSGTVTALNGVHAVHFSGVT